MSQEREVVERIIAYWKDGKKDEARNLLKLSSWVLSAKVKEYLDAKLNGKPDPKSLELLKYACEVFGGGKIYHNDKLIYEKNSIEVKKGTGSKALL